MRRWSYLLLACLMVLGLTQCKKDLDLGQSTTANTYNISLTVDDNSKVNVTPYGDYATVRFQDGDVIHVAYNGKYAGPLTRKGGKFTGEISVSETSQQIADLNLPLYFYFIGNKPFRSEVTTSSTDFSVDISNQTGELPVISMAGSSTSFAGSGSYTAALNNKCALVKFNIKNNVGNPINVNGLVRITGLQNIIKFELNKASQSNNGFSSWGNGIIDLYKDNENNSVRWAILIPDSQKTVTTKTLGYYNNTNVTVPATTASAYIVGDDAVTVNLTQVPEGAFSASDGNFIYFAPGNLQCTTNATPDELGHYDWSSATYSWSFKEHQYDEDLNDINIGENYSNRKSTSHFGWGASGFGTTRPNYTDEELSHYAQGYVDITGTNYDWGRMVGTIYEHDDWRTLTADEWKWILGKNSNATAASIAGTDCRFSSTVNDVENARYTMAQITIGESTINGTILFPDVYTAGTPEGVTWGTINSPVNSWANTKCTEGGWTALADAGCVFLPAAGRHEKDSSGNYKVFGVGENCYYWTTSKYISTDGNATEFASALRIDNKSQIVMFYNSKHHRVKGACVRLVRPVTTSTPNP